MSSLSKEDLIKYTKKLTKKLKLVEEERDALIQGNTGQDASEGTSFQDLLNEKEKENQRILERTRDLLGRFKNLQSKYEEIKSEHAGCSNQFDENSLNSRIDQLEKQAGVDKRAAEEILSLNAHESSVLEADNQYLVSQNKELTATIEKLNQEIKDKTVESKIYIDGLESQISTLTHDLNAKTEEVSRLIALTNDARDEPIIEPSLREELEARIEQNENLKNELSSVSNELAQAEMRMTEFQSERPIDENATSLELESMIEQNENLENELSSVSNELAQAELRMTEFQSEKPIDEKATSLELEAMIEQNENLKNELSSVSNELAQAELRMTEFQSERPIDENATSLELESMIEQNENLKNELSSVCSELAQAELRMTEFESERPIDENATSLELESMIEQNENLKNELSSVSNELAQAELRMTESQSERPIDEGIQAQSIVQGLRDQISASLEINAKLTSKIHELETGISFSEDMALVHAREMIALDTCAIIIASNLESKCKYESQVEELNDELAISRVKELDWRKKASEIAKRFKVLKNHLDIAKTNLVQLKPLHLFSLLHTISTRRQLHNRFSLWKRITDTLHHVTTVSDLGNVQSQVAEEHKKRLEKELGNIGDQHRSTTEQLQQNLETSLKSEKDLALKCESIHSRNAELDEIVSELRVELEETKSILLSASAVPYNFDPKTDILCVVGMPSDIETSICVKSDTHHRWLSMSSLQEWSEMRGFPEVPLLETIQEQIKRDARVEMSMLREEMASIMADKESYKSDLVNYKRRAQLALQKTQDDFRKLEQRNKESDDSLLSQLQSDLARATRMMDEHTGHVEDLKNSNCELEAEVTNSKKLLDEANIARQELECSISGRVDAMKKQLEFQQEKCLDDERAKLVEAENSWNEKFAKMKIKCEHFEFEIISLKEANSKLMLVEATLRHEKDVMEQSNAALRSESTKRKKRTPKKEEVLLSPLEEESILEQVGRQKFGPGPFDDKSPTNLEFVHDAAETRFLERSPSETWDDKSALSINSGANFIVGQLDQMHLQVTRERINWNRSTDTLKGRIEELERELHRAMEQNKLLKEQIREDARNETRLKQLHSNGSCHEEDSSKSLVYLKNVVFQFMVAEQASAKTSLLPVLSTLLQFSPAEITAVKNILESSIATGGVVGWMFG